MDGEDQLHRRDRNEEVLQRVKE